MNYLQQQMKVDQLAAAANQKAKQMQRIRWQIGQKLYSRLQQPGSLAWAFAMGTLFGAARSREPFGSGVFFLLRWINVGATVCGLLLGQPMKEDPAQS
jgi:hypothetical protein